VSGSARCDRKAPAAASDTSGAFATLDKTPTWHVDVRQDEVDVPVAAPQELERLMSGARRGDCRFVFVFEGGNASE
jgi:hypothetical protein